MKDLDLNRYEMSHIWNCCADKDLKLNMIVTDFTVERNKRGLHIAGQGFIPGQA